MATKKLKSAGKAPSYLENCAKLCIYPVDIKGKSISVPQDELETDDLMVAHLVNQYDFKIQSCIPCEVTKREIYNPVLPGPLFPDLRPQPESKESAYQAGNRFRVKSTDCELEISHISGGKIHFMYTNRNKPGFLNSEEQVDKVLRMQSWERI